MQLGGPKMFIWKKSGTDEYICELTQFLVGFAQRNPFFGVDWHENANNEFMSTVCWKFHGPGIPMFIRTGCDTMEQAFEIFEEYAKNFFRMVREIDGYGRIVE
jgi:hypothetical protein